MVAAFSDVQTALKNRSRHWEAEASDLELSLIDLQDAAFMLMEKAG